MTLASGRSPYWPPSFEQTADGNLYIANGIDDTLRVKRYAATATLAGIAAPSTAASLAFSGSGALDGSYYAYVRFVDEDGIPSPLSPISTVAVAASDAQADYTSVPVSSNSRVTKRQIFRNTDGQTEVFYLDVEIDDNSTTTATSTKTDAQLQASEPLPIYEDDGTVWANRFEPPPTHKAVLVQHQDRMWFAVDVAYGQGNAKCTNGSDTVEGLGTNWVENFVGRFLHLPSAATSYEITAVDVNAQTLTIADNYPDTTRHFTYYYILPHPDERNKVYFSWPGEPESVPADFSFKIQELGGDELTGLMPLGQFLFVLMRKHIYRISFGLSPLDDLAVTKTVSRGCVNHRCWMRVEDLAYLLDREGIHCFEGGHDGGQTQHVSEAIQDYFRDGKINWAQERFFFASYSPIEEIVRFHVCLGGSYLPRHAFAYHYRHKAWSIEQYPIAFGGACLPWMQGYERCLLGGQYDQHYLQGEGTLDGMVDPGGSQTYRAFCDSATLTAILDADAVWPSDAVNAPIAIVAGRGQGQVNRVVQAASGRIDVLNPWRIKPDSTSVYQLGAIPWKMVSGTYRFLPEAQANDVIQHNRRRVRVACEPTENAANIEAKLFLDHSAQPRNDYLDYAGDDGVSTRQGSPYVTIDIQATNEFSGYRHFSLDQSIVDPRFVHQWLTVELSGFQGRDPVKLYSFAVDGVQ